MSEIVQDVRSDTESLLRVDDLTKKFGSVVAADEVDLAVTEGELHSIIGPNGAGKTTLFNMIAGSLSPSAGKVIFNGKDITGLSMDARTRRGISRAYQVTQLFNDLSIGENLRLAAQATDQSFNVLSKTDTDHCDEADEMFEQLSIDAATTDQASSLPHGDKKKVGIGMALLTDPELLLLDEPTSGLSATDSEKIVDFLEEVTEDLTVLLIEHDVEMVLSISDRITVLHQGSIIARGTPEEIVDNDDVQRAYLGGY